MEIVDLDGEALDRLPYRYQNDKEVVIRAIKNDLGNPLEIAIYTEIFEKWKDDRDVVMEAVKISGDSLEYASERLRDDKDVAMQTISSNGGWGLEYVSRRLLKDNEVVLKALEECYKSETEQFDTAFKTYESNAERVDVEVVKQYVKKYGGFDINHLSGMELRMDETLLEANLKNMVFEDDFLNEYFN